MSRERIARIEARLTEVFSPVHLAIEDDGHKHVGHAGAKQGGHFNVLLVSELFAGQTLMQRHRMVYTALSDLMQTDIHALSLRVYIPQEFEDKQK